MRHRSKVRDRDGVGPKDEVMPAAKIVICNRTKHTMYFHLEPDCIQFELEPGKSLEVSGTYDVEPISIHYSDDAEFGIFGSIFPGDGNASVRIDGLDPNS